MDSHLLYGRIGGFKFSEYNGNQVCNVSLAIDTGTKEKPKTTWYRVAVWGENGVKRLQQEHVKPGTIMNVEGRNLHAQAYLDKSGKPQAQLCLTAQRFRLINAAKMEGAPVPTAPAIDDDFVDLTALPAFPSEGADDVPF